jgi:2-polyprenyl-6-hydroxyphenyl methylase/3-demethylubiquinone-9 3-methyltransferase
MASFENVDHREIEKFEKVAQIWWDTQGEMGTLQTINPLRTNFIMERLTLSKPHILDIGCGGGILSEALARAGAHVTGIDVSPSAIQVARQHAKQQGLEIDYRYTDVDQYAHMHASGFDAVTCMEMLEHVPKPEHIVAAGARALKTGGHAFFSSINRTPKAYLFAVLIGEYVLHLLPLGTHQYHKLIRPQELKEWGQRNGLEYIRISSLMYNPITRKFRVAAGREDVNYMMHFSKKETVGRK